jgi:predicted Zn-dependent protease
MIKYAIENQGWKQVPIHNTTTEISTEVEQLVDAAHQRAENVSALSSAALTPNYIYLETEILTKARQLLQHVDANDPNTPNILKTLTSVLGELKKQSGTHKGNQEGDGRNSIKIMVANRYQVVESDSGKGDSAVEVVSRTF